MVNALGRYFFTITFLFCTGTTFFFRTVTIKRKKTHTKREDLRLLPFEMGAAGEGAGDTSQHKPIGAPTQS